MPAQVSAALQATLQRAHDAMLAAGVTSAEEFERLVRDSDDTAAFVENVVQRAFGGGPIDGASVVAQVVDDMRVYAREEFDRIVEGNTITTGETEVPTLTEARQIPLIEEDRGPGPTLRYVELSDIEEPDPPGNPSVAFTENVRQLGILQPIILREVPDGEYHIIAGTRRLAAAAACGHLSIPALVYPNQTTGRMQAAAALSENMQRSSNVVRDVDMIDMLLQAGESWDAVRDRLRLSPSQMTRRAMLLNLTPQWRVIFRDRRMAMVTASLLAQRQQRVQYQVYEALSTVVDGTHTITSRAVRGILEMLAPRVQPNIQIESFDLTTGTVPMPEARWTHEQVRYAASLMAQSIVMGIADGHTREELVSIVQRGVSQVASFMGEEPDTTAAGVMVNYGMRNAVPMADTSTQPTRYTRVGNGRIPIGNEQPVDDPDTVTMAEPAPVPSITTNVADEGWATVVQLLEQVETVIPANGEEITDDFAVRLNQLLTDANEGRRTERLASATPIRTTAAAAALRAQDAATAMSPTLRRRGARRPPPTVADIPVPRRREVGALSEITIDTMIDTHVRNGSVISRDMLRTMIIGERRGALAREHNVPTDRVDVRHPGGGSTDRRVIFSINEEN